MPFRTEISWENGEPKIAWEPKLAAEEETASVSSRSSLKRLDKDTPVAYNYIVIFIETSLFTTRIVRLMDDDDYRELQKHLGEHPDSGAVIVGSGGVRKIRWSGSGRGKRGGSRLIYYWNYGDKILMLYAYLKNEREDLSPEHVALMREIAKEFKNE